MEYAALTFVICLAVIVGAYWLLVAEPEAAEAKRLGKRLKRARRARRRSWLAWPAPQRR